MIDESLQEREQRLKDKQKRLERKKLEQKRKDRENDRQARKRALLNENPYLLKLDDEYQDDILNFKDSDRDSLISYIQQNTGTHEANGPSIKNVGGWTNETAAERAGLMQIGLIDTPTRLVNESNEFLEMQLDRKRKRKIPTADEGDGKGGKNRVVQNSCSQELNKKQQRKENLLKLLKDQQLN